MTNRILLFVCRILLFLQRFQEIEALARILPAQGSWGNAEYTPDVGGEVAVAGEAHRRRDLGEGEIGVGE